MSIITLNTRSLPDSAVTTAKIAADAITDAKIADDVVGTEHLTAGEVDATALGADSVTAAKINNDIISGSTELASEPADTDEFLVSDAGTLKRIDYSLIKGGGITMADQWRITADLTTSSSDLTSNFERNDSTGFGYIGSGMSESSGIFTFPSTGIYLVEFNVLAYGSSAGDIRYGGGQIYVTTDNSSYTKVVEQWNGNNQHGSPYYFSANMKTFVDVTDTSNVKVKFNVAASASVVFDGSTSNNRTHMTFIRLGDT